MAAKKKEEKKELSLLQKLMEIRKAVGYLQKENHNRTQGFSYVSSSQVLGAVREKMNELGLLIVPKVRETQFDILEGQKQNLTHLWLTYTWVDVVTGEEMEIPWYGQGADMHEKGVGKALTYAEKYFILKFFNIPTDKDDPDAWEGKHNDNAPSQRQNHNKPAPQAGSKYITIGSSLHKKLEAWIRDNIGKGDDAREAFKLWAKSIDRLDGLDDAELSMKGIHRHLAESILKRPQAALDSFTEWYEQYKLDQKVQEAQDVFEGAERVA
ncbi:MAG: ERF family protein [Deltaproteobacteria bacterium]|nr:ERF family protein [Deltaproteobacteria bacterium]MBW2081620.1 ERF family protein [Deltaproteobacteria bacterium]